VLHDDELPADADLVRRLVASQFPAWADEPIEPHDSAGSSNWIFLLGGDKYVRLRRRPAEPSKVLGEQAWLGRLAPELPFPIPRVLGRGEPGEGYPLPWTVLDWLPGESAATATFDQAGLADDVAGFVRAIRMVDAADGPPPSDDNNWRAEALVERDRSMRRALARCDGLLDVAAVTARWERSLAAPVWDGPPTFVHGDLMAGNVLVEDGRLAAVIDFGCLAVGDPAVDLMAGWALLEADARGRFRDAVGADDASWERGAGWALSVGVIALPYYLHTQPTMTRQNRTLIEQVMIDG
jgi:aminoglycoside phosphotransferase (APT) family kinase protein